MGVRHLESFITRTVPNGSHRIDIEDEIRKRNDSQWRRNAPKPTIVIDLMSLYSPIGDTNVPGSMCGGRYTLVYRRLDQFFTKLKSLGAILVFYCDGPVQDDKYPTWFERQKVKYGEVIEILDAVDEGIDLGTLITRFQREFPGNTLYPVKEVAKRHGKIVTSIANECDKELVQYANSVNAMAIISNDSDFLIYEGFWQYWSIKDMNFETLTTKVYNRTVLVKDLGLTFEQMPLLATLAGNDIILYDEVKEFHATLGRPRNKFYDLARFVDQQRFPFKSSDGGLQEMLSQVFGAAKVSEELVNRFQKSLDIYDLSKRNQVEKSDETANLLVTLGCIFMYQIYMGLPFDVSGFVCDLRSQHLGWQYPQLTIRLEKRKTGIILYHRENSIVTLVTKLSHEEEFDFLYFQAEFPQNIYVPPLLDLLSKEPIVWTSLFGTKLALLCWIASDTLDYRKLLDIPPVLHPTLLTLYFLLENHVLRIFEADLLLQIAFDVAFERCDLLRVPYPCRKFNPRAFRIAFLYPKVYNHLAKAVRIVGLDGPGFREHPMFDGFLFHRRYEEWEQGKGQTEEIRQWRIYAHLVTEEGE